jgi:hypothetical protein
MPALSVWFAAVAAIVVCARLALAERGEGLAILARMLAAVAGAVAMAAAVWLVARRSRLWFHRALVVALAVASAGLVAHWEAGRRARARADEDVLTSMRAVNAAGPEQVEARLADLESAARSASPKVRAVAEVTVETRRETERRNVSYGEASQKLTAANALDLTTVKEAGDLLDRVALCRAFAHESAAWALHQRDVHDNYAARLHAAQGDDGAQHLTKPAAASDDEEHQLGQQAREAEQRWAEAVGDMLGMLAESWGAWEAPQGALTWKDQAAASRYAALEERMQRLSGEYHKMDARLAVSDVEVPKASPLEARRGFVTRVRTAAVKSPFARVAAAVPPPRDFLRVSYRSLAGDLAAYVSPDPLDRRRHAAVLWAHGGFDGIGNYLWEAAPAENDQSVRAFREAGLVVMAPSWRGENKNPGNFEMFYGELDDLFAAREYLASLPYVDGERIYVAGHSVGGTLALLAAAEPGRFRAAFSFGGAPDIEKVARGSPITPFDVAVTDEIRLRSPITFVGAIAQPTFYFEGAAATDFPPLRRMEALGAKAAVPFEVHVVHGGDHFSILAPLTRLIARKIVEDTGKTCAIRITDDEIRGALVPPASPTGAPR